MNAAIRRSHLLDPYRATLHRVTGGAAPFDLRVDRRSAPLAELLPARDIHKAAFLTTHNPLSKMTDPTRNRAMQSLFLDRIRRSGSAWLDGIGIDPKG